MSKNSPSYWLDHSAEEVFNSMDTNKDNILSKDELKRALEANEIPTSEKLLTNIFNYCDKNKDGKITKEKFTNFTNEQNEKLNSIFNTIDINQSGFLSIDEVKKVVLDLDSNYEHYKLNKMLQKLDRNGDGKIDKNEFMKFYHMIPVNNIKMTFDFFSKEGIDIGESFTIPNEKDEDPKDSKK